jgi:hypothetical protein
MTETRTDLVGRLRRMGGWRRYALILAGDSLAIAAALYLPIAGRSSCAASPSCSPSA